MFRSSPQRIVLVAGFLSLCASVASAQLPTPQLTSLYPPGAKAGAKLEITAGGTDLDEADAILFSHPGITATAKMGEPIMPGKPGKPVLGQFALSVAGDVPPGLYEARVRGRFGVSNPRTFVVSTSEEVAEAAGNTSAEKAQELVIGTVVNARGDANTRDYYKLSLKANDRVIIALTAGRIDSRMDPVVSILNAQGRELARARNSLSSDPVIDFKAPSDGVYNVVVFDFLYGGGPDYAYRLLAHKSPLVDFVFPPAGTAGTQGAFTIYGRNLPGGQPAGISLGNIPLEKVTANIAIPADPTTQVGALLLPRSTFNDAFTYRLDSPSGPSNPVSIGIASEAIVPEQEPNDTPDKAQKLNVPCEIAGQFYPARDRDMVQFDAKKGDVFTIEVIAHRLGLNSDPSVTVQRVTKNDKGEEMVADVATVDDPQERQQRIGSDFDTSTDDASYRLNVTDDGTYRLLVRDNFGESRTDPRSVYRLVIRKEKPDFRVAVYLDPPTSQNNQNQSPLSANVLRKGGTLELRVALDRRDGFNGEVTITAEGMPAGVTCPGAIIGGNQEMGSLVFTCAENAASASSPIKVTAKANINGQDVVRTARIGTCVWGTTDRNQRPPEFRIARDLVLSVMDKEMQPAMVVVGEDKVYETARGANLEIPVKVTRRDGFNEAIKLTKANLPNEMQVKEINIGAGAADGKLEMTLNQQNIKAGTYTFYLKGETKLKYARNPDAIKNLEAEIKDFADMQKALADALTKANTDKQTATTAQQTATNEKNAAEKAKNDANTASQQAAAKAKEAADKVPPAKDAAAKDAANKALADAAAAAEKAAADTAAAAKAATDKLAETEKALAAAVEKLKAADEAKTKADAAATDAQAKVTAATAQKQALDQQLNQVKQANQPKDVNIILVSTPVKVRIIDCPLKITAPPAAATVKAGEKVEVPVGFERMFGFADTVELNADNAGIGGLTVQKADVPKDQAQGKLTLTTTKETKPGDYMLTVKAKSRFNNVQSEISVPLTLKVVAP